ncbi:hypothetical protein [Flavivirga jejuensis]|uniref:Uncharacterized protein n=1 Tax=Flavivirga jejuensis TaxID=870487 RepID=A0ABT8WPF4_9FLAO|nr:hypothetical protein [Flavivirga jejuensis]MDO5974859.1 hypothetical protein [Flavivirga jejuensis]
MYASEQNPSDYNKKLRVVFVLIEEDEKFKIVQYGIYSDFSTDGLSYQWEYYGGGYEDLTLDKLGSPVSIERYQEPIESFDGLKHYNAHI